jgi:hypothetical protein
MYNVTYAGMQNKKEKRANQAPYIMYQKPYLSKKNYQQAAYNFVLPVNPNTDNEFKSQNTVVRKKNFFLWMAQHLSPHMQHM